MSKLIKHINARQTGKVSPAADFSWLVDVYHNIEELKYPQGYEYRLEVSLGNSIIVHNTDELPHAIDSVKRSVAEFVFGEFKERLYKIEKAAYNHNWMEVVELSRSIQKDMFDIGGE